MEERNYIGIAKIKNTKWSERIMLNEWKIIIIIVPIPKKRIMLKYYKYKDNI